MTNASRFNHLKNEETYYHWTLIGILSVETTLLHSMPYHISPPLLHQNCKFLILLFDIIEESRVLSTGEFTLRRLCQDRLDQSIRERPAYWKQCGKCRQLQEDDANTSYLHARATNRMRRNQIRSIEVAGTVFTSHEDKTQALTAHFSALMAAAAPSTWSFDLNALYAGQPRVQGDALLAPFTAQEARSTVRAMNRDSAPGPDGFGPSFFQVAWEAVEAKLMSFLSAFHGHAVQLERINRAYIVLLPKKENATTADSYRPICLQNFLPKLASKIMTSRLQRQITSLIGTDQTGFMRGRSISENFVYAVELVQCCHKRKVPTLGLKLDFAKAFDSVHWDSLLCILEVHGFPAQWNGWVHSLLSTSRSAVLVNGCPGPWMHCKKGLRQGDPISPYLFILVADVLQTLIQADAGVRHPIVAARSCPVLQ